MCFSNSQKLKPETSIQLDDIEKDSSGYDFLDHSVVNGFDFGVTAVLKPTETGKDFDVVTMEWGFIPDPMGWPFWETREQVNVGRVAHKDPNGKFVDGLNFLNAVSEEVLKPRKVYRDAALSRPCLFLSTGYFEWRHIYPRNKRTGEPRKTPEKYPYRVYIKNKDYFYIAGIWQQWADVDTGEVTETCSMLTTAANEVAAEIHNSKKRQPTVLTNELASEWLFGERTEKRIQEIASFQISYETMGYYTLAKDFLNSNDPLKPHYYPELPPLNVPGGDKNEARGSEENLLF